MKDESNLFRLFRDVRLLITGAIIGGWVVVYVLNTQVPIGARPLFRGLWLQCSLAIVFLLTAIEQLWVRVRRHRALSDEIAARAHADRQPADVS